MTAFLARIAMVILSVSALTLLGNIMNDFFFVAWLTNFFTLLRTIVRPLTFIWDFDTSWTLIGLSLSILISYFIFKAFLVIKALLTSNT